MFIPLLLNAGAEVAVVAGLLVPGEMQQEEEVVVVPIQGRFLRLHPDNLLQLPLVQEVLRATVVVETEAAAVRQRLAEFPEPAVLLGVVVDLDRPPAMVQAVQEGMEETASFSGEEMDRRGQ